MKRIIGLGLAVAVVLFTACKNENKGKKSTKNNVEKKADTSSALVTGEMKIAYYVYDSIPTMFEFYKSESETLEREGRTLEKKLMGMQQQYESKARQYQKGMQSQTLTPNQMQNYEQQLQGLQQKMSQFQNGEMAAFQQKQMQSNTALSNKVAEYGKEFGKMNGLTMFLIVGTGSSTAYVDNAMDLTTEFIDYMNEQESALESDSIN